MRATAGTSPPLAYKKSAPVPAKLATAHLDSYTAHFGRGGRPDGDTPCSRAHEAPGYEVTGVQSRDWSERPWPIKITEDCIDCGTCEPECPNEAIKRAGPLTPQRAAPVPCRSAVLG
ncbi:4Fe-4S binding protein [[Kitasatospora] papulosa]|uniref:4Fe-4S binding protein n=1 Tax=[Kitasatospora] papulosa TaxID=1464011 RepID=UPI00362FDCAB